MSKVVDGGYSSSSWQISEEELEEKHEKKEAQFKRKNEETPVIFAVPLLLSHGQIWLNLQRQPLSPMQSPVSYALIQLALLFQLSGLAVTSWMDFEALSKGQHGLLVALWHAFLYSSYERTIRRSRAFW